MRMPPDSIVSISARPGSDEISTAGQVTPWGISRVGGPVDGTVGAIDNGVGVAANGTYVRTISAHDSSDTMPSWSNWGNPPVDYAAPGVSVLSTAAGGGTTTYSGTSMASPHACAVMMMKNGNPATDGTVNGDPDSIIHM